MSEEETISSLKELLEENKEIINGNFTPSVLEDISLENLQAIQRFIRFV